MRSVSVNFRGSPRRHILDKISFISTGRGGDRRKTTVALGIKRQGTLSSWRPMPGRNGKGRTETALCLPFQLQARVSNSAAIFGSN